MPRLPDEISLIISGTDPARAMSGLLPTVSMRIDHVLATFEIHLCECGEPIRWVPAKEGGFIPFDGNGDLHSLYCDKVAKSLPQQPLTFEQQAQIADLEKAARELAEALEPFNRFWEKEKLAIFFPNPSEDGSHGFGPDLAGGSAKILVADLRRAAEVLAKWKGTENARPK